MTLGERTRHDSTVDALNRTNIFGYDSMNRKIAHIMPAGQSEGRACDFDGNQVVETNFDGTVITNLYDSMNRLTNTDKYDSNGNTTNSGSSVFQYDVMNHLTNAWVNGAQILMTYDGDGDRVSKTVGTVTTYYLLDSQNPSGYSQVLEEWTNTAMAKVYNYGLDLINQRQPGISTNYFLFDGHGSTRMLTDIGGTVVNVWVYDAYGNLIASNGAPQTAYLYSGQQWDSDLGLYLNRARYLNPNTGRFWTMDGDYGNNEDPLSLHKYLYAQDDPVNGIDPSGDDAEGIEGNISAVDNFSVNLNVGLVGEIGLTPNAALGPGDSLTVENIHEGQTITLQNGTVNIRDYSRRPATGHPDLDQKIGAQICMVPNMDGSPDEPYCWRQYVDSDDPDGPLKHHLDVVPGAKLPWYPLQTPGSAYYNEAGCSLNAYVFGDAPDSYAPAAMQYPPTDPHFNSGKVTWKFTTQLVKLPYPDAPDGTVVLTVKWGYWYTHSDNGIIPDQ